MGGVSQAGTGFNPGSSYRMYGDHPVQLLMSGLGSGEDEANGSKRKTFHLPPELTEAPVFHPPLDQISQSLWRGQARISAAMPTEDFFLA